MKVTIHKVKKEKNGWLITLKAHLEPPLDQKDLKKLGDWKVSSHNDYLYLNNYFDRSEPWEDTHLDEIRESAIIEVTWRLGRINASL